MQYTLFPLFIILQYSLPAVEKTKDYNGALDTVSKKSAHKPQRQTRRGPSWAAVEFDVLSVPMYLWKTGSKDMEWVKTPAVRIAG